MPVPTPHSCIRGSYIFHPAFPSLSQRLQISLLNNQANDLRVLFVCLRLHTFSFIFLSSFFLSSPTCLLLSLLHLPFASLLHLHYDSYRLLFLSSLFVYFNPHVCPLYRPTFFFFTKFSLHPTNDLPLSIRHGSSSIRTTSLPFFTSVFFLFTR